MCPVHKTNWTELHRDCNDELSECTEYGLNEKASNSAKIVWVIVEGTLVKRLVPACIAGNTQGYSNSEDKGRHLFLNGRSFPQGYTALQNRRL